jgi:CMP-N,N'-diacetyllegionaminic acid synthase
MKVLGIVPARGGSKRFPRKNITDLGGKPLIAWTLETAIQSKVFDRLVVSSEDEEIGRIVNSIADDIWWKRDLKLARDDTPTMPVIMEVFDRYPAEIVVTLQPTSPFRTAEDIIKSVEMLERTRGDSVFSVTDAPADLAFEVGHAQRLRNIPNIVVPNGALFLITGDVLRKGESWFSGIAYGYSMPKDRSLDIDTEMDLEIARMIVSRGMNGK